MQTQTKRDQEERYREIQRRENEERERKKFEDELTRRKFIEVLETVSRPSPFPPDEKR